MYLSNSAVAPHVLGPQGAQSVTKVTDIEMPEPSHSNDGGGHSKGGKSQGMHSTTAGATSVLGTVWKIAVRRGHNPVTDMEDTLLIYW